MQFPEYLQKKTSEKCKTLKEIGCNMKKFTSNMQVLAKKSENLHLRLFIVFVLNQVVFVKAIINSLTLYAKN